MVFLLIPSVKSFCQITVDFTSSQTTGCGSVNAAFSDLSNSTAGIITSWSWDLSGVTSSSASPGHIYSLPGSYTICLTVQDIQGNEGTLCKDNFITVFALPQPDFVADNPVGCAPLEVHYDDLSTTSGSNITEWIWGVGGSAGVITDDGTATEISSVYDVPDNYTISLTITDDNNCTNTVTKESYIQADELPILNISANQTSACVPPFQVNFSNNVIQPGVSYTWYFGNGASYNGAIPPSINYGQTGSYTITVIAETIDSGCKDTLILEDYIQVGKIASFTHSPESGCKDLVVEFTDTSPEPADSVYWSFGDGNFSTEFNPIYTYTNNGCYTATLIRYVGECVSSINSQTCIDVYNIPDVSFDMVNALGCIPPHDVDFNNQTIGGVSFEWDFGDGITSTEASPTHTYTDFGVYPVQLIATNSNGCSVTSMMDTVRIFPIESQLLTGDQFDCTPLDVTLMSGSNSYTPIVSWEWTLTNYSTAPVTIVESNDEFPNLTLTDTGRYEIQLIITNTLGCTDTAIYQNMIGVGMLPQADFVAMPDTGCVNDVITFTDQSSPFVDEWEWFFGDGETSGDQNPTHEYTSLGSFDVSLNAFHLGCMNTFMIEDYVYIDPPLAGFSVTMSCIDFLTVDVTDISLGATSVFYDFGVEGIDTDTSSSPNPTYIYTDEGEYYINQYVYNDSTGCSDTITLGITVGIPDANFAIPTTTGCVPLVVQVQDLSLFASEYEYSWLDPAGGLGTSPEGEEPILTFEAPGKYYDFKLLITDINGCQDSLVFTDTIYVNAVDANFAADPAAGCLPLDVTLIDQSSSLFGNVNEWEYTMIDFPGDTLTNQNSNYIFDDYGYFTVTLKATDDWGCYDSIVVDSAVFVTAPISDFSADTFGCTKAMVPFTALASGLGLSYSWDFGDGELSTEVHPEHQYQNEGAYTVCLTITDLNGCVHTACKQDYIVIADPVAAFAADTTSGFCPPLLVNFENNSLNASTYEWNFGDNSGLSNLENAAHVYTTPGIFDVTLIATSIAACSDTLTIPEMIDLDGPVGDFYFDQDTSCAPAPITFVANSVDYYTYTWDFGNGDQDTSANVVYDSLAYTYLEAGHYVTKLILKDNAGCQRVLESPDTIVIGSLDIDFLALDTALCGGENFTNFINTTVSSDSIEFIEWTFHGATPYNSNFNNVGVEYDTLGAFDVQLIMDNGICRDTLVRNDYIQTGAIPEVEFSPDPPTGCTPLSIQFTDLSSVEGSNIVSWEWDFGDSNTSTEQNPNHIFEDGSTSTFPINLTVTAETGCTQTGSDLIIVLPLPTFTIPTPATICQGEEVALIPDFPVDTIGYIYQWMPDPTLSCTNCFSPMANPLDTTTYTLITTNNFGCTYTSSVDVNVRPFAVPVITLSEDTTICINANTQLQATGGDDIFSYQWDTSTPGLSCYESCFNPVASPEVTSTYVLTVTNEGGCSTQDSVTVTVSNEYVPFAGDDRTICEGDTIQLSLSTGNDPQWINPQNLSCTYCDDPIAFPDQTTAYMVTAQTDFGCEIIDTIEIEVVHVSDISAGVDNTICDGETIMLEGIGEGTVTWTPQVSLDDPAILNPNASPIIATTYVIEVVNGECTMSDSVLIAVNENTEVSSIDMTICLGDSITLDVLGEADTYSWNFAESLSRTDVQDPLAYPTETTTYTVTAQLATCNPDTASATVFVNGIPQFRTTETRFFVSGQTVELIVYPEQEGELLYEWTPSTGLSCDDCASPSVAPDETTVYTLYVTDAETGCVEERTITVQELYSCPEELFAVPNAFSPNDDGFNDELELIISPSIESIESFQIYNRWGALVFATDDRYATWDGTFKGKPAHTGVYVYLLKVKCELDGETILKRGDITLVR